MIPMVECDLSSFSYYFMSAVECKKHVHEPCKQCRVYCSLESDFFQDAKNLQNGTKYKKWSNVKNSVFLKPYYEANFSEKPTR